LHREIWTQVQPLLQAATCVSLQCLLPWAETLPNPRRLEPLQGHLQYLHPSPLHKLICSLYSSCPSSAAWWWSKGKEEARRADWGINPSQVTAVE